MDPYAYPDAMAGGYPQMNPGSSPRVPQGARAQHSTQHAPVRHEHARAPSDPRHRMYPPSQQSPTAAMIEHFAPVHHSSASVGGESDQWPLPPQALGQGPPRSASPTGPLPKRPPRPPRAEYQQGSWDRNMNRQHARGPSGHGPHPRNPPMRRPYHDGADWIEENYIQSGRPGPSAYGYQNRPPPQRPNQRPPPNMYNYPPPMYYDQRNYRPQYGAPPPQPRRGPPPPQQYQTTVAPMIAEETARSRSGSLARTHPTPNDGGLAPFTPPFAQGNKNVPSYYFEQRGETPTPGVTPDVANELHEPTGELPTIKPTDQEDQTRDEPTPEPIGPIRQASVGKKTRPTLTTVKRSNSSSTKRTSSSGTTSSSRSNRPPEIPASSQLTPFEEQLEEQVEKLPGAWISEGPTPANDSMKDRSLTVGDAVAGAAATNMANNHSGSQISSKRRSSEVLGSDVNMPKAAPAQPSFVVPEVVSPLETPGSVLSVDDGVEISPILSRTTLNKPQSISEPRGNPTAPAPAPLADATMLKQHIQPQRPPLSPGTPRSQDDIHSRLPVSPADATAIRQVTQPPPPAFGSPRDDMEFLQPRSPPTPNAQASRFSPDTDTTALNPSNDGFPGMSDNQRPDTLSLDIAAVRETEARGSMTSLPDLIRRATKVQRNLDRGKTASRLGLGFFDNASTDAINKLKIAEANNRSAENLGLFPPPAGGARGSRGGFSAMLRRSQIPDEIPDEKSGEKKQGRKCCGLSLRAFGILVVVLFLLVVAAIVIPVVLVVLPKHGSGSEKQQVASANTLAECQKELDCQNGGMNILGGGNTCSCLCVNGYTGTNCETFSKNGCDSISAGSTNKATVGEDVVPLLGRAASQYQIPLDGETLLGLFSKSNLTCAEENKLVTIRTGSTSQNTDSGSGALSDREKDFRQRHQETPPARPSKIKRAETDSDDESTFAKVAVLYIFQQTAKLHSASQAHDKFESYFSQRQDWGAGGLLDARNITLGNGFSCDIYQQSLVWTLKNGTTVSS